MYNIHYIYYAYYYSVLEVTQLDNINVDILSAIIFIQM